MSLSYGISFIRINFLKRRSIALVYYKIKILRGKFEEKAIRIAGAKKLGMLNKLAASGLSAKGGPAQIKYIKVAGNHLSRTII